MAGRECRRGSDPAKKGDLFGPGGGRGAGMGRSESCQGRTADPAPSPGGRRTWHRLSLPFPSPGRRPGAAHDCPGERTVSGVKEGGEILNFLTSLQLHKPFWPRCPSAICSRNAIGNVQGGQLLHSAPPPLPAPLPSSPDTLHRES